MPIKLLQACQICKKYLKNCACFCKCTCPSFHTTSAYIFIQSLLVALLAQFLSWLFNNSTQTSAIKKQPLVDQALQGDRTCTLQNGYKYTQISRYTFNISTFSIFFLPFSHYLAELCLRSLKSTVSNVRTYSTLLNST